MVVKGFDFAGIPEIIFHKGAFADLPHLIAEKGSNLLLVTGGSSLRKMGYYDKLSAALKNLNISISNIRVKEEPAPELIDKTVGEYKNKNIDVVVAIGGGSVMDTGKAVSAMLTTPDDSVMRYLEKVGEGVKHPGSQLPLIAVPTTSGTGSEATKNAVLSRVGEDGFKKSLRHDNFIPVLALLDAELTVSCPPDITAASGLDAITQLMGAYVSTEASEMTDPLTFNALKIAGKSIIPVCTDQADDVDYRADMAYASLVSGIVLANAGLGIVHGLASPVGGFFDIPHGVVCGTVFAETVKINIKLLKEQKGGARYLNKYARIGAHWSEREKLYYEEKNIEKCCQLLVETIEKWLEKLDISRLSEFGIKESDLDKIAENTGNKNNPVPLNKEQIKKILKNRL